MSFWETFEPLGGGGTTQKDAMAKNDKAKPTFSIAKEDSTPLEVHK